ncbi:MAG: low specificity L-threonine aldolase [Bacteroidales bacterium]|nr:low specificity L-threonine aldolase [Bacteroidales bacterium]
MKSFGSDNHSGIHPDILRSIEMANTEHALAYGDDSFTTQAKIVIRQMFGENAEPFFVFNGTGANMISLQACVQSYHAIISAKTAHIAVDECGAPEFLTGATLKEIDTSDGKLTPELIQPWLHGWNFEHHSQPKAVYISQCTELGTVYTPEEIKLLADFLHQYHIYLHVDGARIANAAAFLGKSFKEMTTDCGVDIVSFGGTKNGMLMGEVVIALRPELAENIKYIRKQTTQLYSKMRFMSCQFLAYFHNDLWLKNATHANEMAQRLRKGIESISNFEFSQKTEANIIILKMPPKIIDALMKKHFFYVWDEQQNEVRFVTSWDTTENDIELFLNDLKAIILS